jgi:hypothetical protein
MVLIKILKRRDASSIVVAILIAMIVSQPLSMMTGKPASIISGISGDQGYFYGGPGGDWQNQYLFPVVWALLQLLILEILGWILVLANRPVKRTRK